MSEIFASGGGIGKRSAIRVSDNTYKVWVSGSIRPASSRRPAIQA
jgi:hypothetical protein